MARGQVSPRRRLLAIGAMIIAAVHQLQPARLNVVQYASPKLHSFANGQGIGVRHRFLGAGSDVQPAQNHLCPALAIPVGQGVGPPGEGQVDGNSDHLGKGLPGRRALQQVLVPVGDFPVGRRGSGNAAQGQTRRQYVLAEAGVRILGIEGIYQQGIARLDRSRPDARLQRGRNSHVRRT